MASQAMASRIWPDADLLDGGTFSWRVVQQDYAHLVDFTLLTDTRRPQFQTLLGGTSWWGLDADGAASPVVTRRELTVEPARDPSLWVRRRR